MKLGCEDLVGSVTRLGVPRSTKTGSVEAEEGRVPGTLVDTEVLGLSLGEVVTTVSSGEVDSI